MSVGPGYEIAVREERRQALATVDIGDESEPVGGGWMTFAGAGSWANQACALGIDGPVSGADLDRLVEFYRSRGVEPRIEVCSFAHESLLVGLAERGFVLKEFENVFVRTLDGVDDWRALHPNGWPMEVGLARVDPTDADQVEEHVRVAMSGFTEVPNEAMLEAGRRSTRHPETVAFNAVVDGRLVGAGAMGLSQGIGVLFGTSVLPEFRRRGIQLALILERLRVASEGGAPFVTIHSAPGISTERNAARLGFTLAYVKVVMVRPTPGLAPSP